MSERVFEGYSSEAHARALAFAGEPLRLDACDGWVLRRPIPSTGLFDAMGCYPLFACRDWSGIAEDLQRLAAGDVVSLTLVAEPFAPIEQFGIARHFELARPYKKHYLTDLSGGPQPVASAHHRRNARRGLRKLEVHLHSQPLAMLADWMRLYRALTVRHAITDLRAFTPEYFGALLAIDDVLMVCARNAGEVVGAQIYVLQGDVAFFHLSACSPPGYADDASPAMCWSAIELLRDRVAWIDWGGAAGAVTREHDGLAWFKSGWSNQTRDAWLLGAVLDRERYAALARNHAQTSYFPAYRAGEFT